VAGFLLLFFALARLQILEFSKYQQLSQANRIRILPQSASRGRILDRNGNVLAGNTLSYNLLVMPQEAGRSEGWISKLSAILSMPQEELNSKLQKKNTASFAPALLCENISLEEAIAIGQLKYDLPQVVVQVVPKRAYPLGNVASHVLGYIGKIDAWRLEKLKKYGYKIQDLVGKSGIEEVYDYLLRAVDGGMQIEVDNRGRLSRVLGFKAPSKGKDVQLTIDLRIQKIIHEYLKGHTGCVIVLNPLNGEVLALASFPDFNPQIFLDGSPSAVNRLLNDPDSPLLNRAISGLYPPGSIFKVIVAAAGLEKKKIDARTTFFCPGYMQIGNRRFSCWSSHGQESIFDALAHSCNVFFYNLGLRLGPQLITKYAQKFGFGQRAGIDLNGESAGYLPYSLWERIKRRRTWFSGDTANLSIGQGEILVTPLQVARAMAAVANGGKLIQPRLLESIKDEGKTLEPKPPQIIDLGLSEENLRIIKEGLARAVSDSHGTAYVLADAGISIAGKTGTAQVDSGQAHGWFAGYFPADKPKFVICVFLEHSGTGLRSCLLAKKIIKRMLAEGLL